jgi:hypothetical protein
LERVGTNERLKIPRREPLSWQPKVGYAARIETEMLLEVVQNTEQVVDFNSTGEVAERLNAPVLKSTE